MNNKGKGHFYASDSRIFLNVCLCILSFHIFSSHSILVLCSARMSCSKNVLH